MQPHIPQEIIDCIIDQTEYEPCETEEREIEAENYLDEDLDPLPR